MPEELMIVLGTSALCAAAFGVAAQVASVFRARAAAIQQFEYRQLVHDANDAHRQVTEALDRAMEEIGALRARTESMERLLKEVG